MKNICEKCGLQTYLYASQNSAKLCGCNLLSNIAVKENKDKSDIWIVIKGCTNGFIVEEVMSEKKIVCVDESEAVLAVDMLLEKRK